MATILRARDLKPDELTGLLAGLRFPEDQKVRAWLDGLDGWSLAYWPGVEGRVPWYGAGRLPAEEAVRDLLPRLVGGRLFAPAGELRWRRLPALGASPCRAVYLGQELDSVAALDPRDELAGLSPRPDGHPLWGLLTAATRGREGDPDAWVELRVPHRFRYPVPAPDPSWARVGVKALVETWCDERGEPQFVRLCDLQAYPGE
jgi:hypothetical protein